MLRNSFVSTMFFKQLLFVLAFVISTPAFAGSHDGDDRGGQSMSAARQEILDVISAYGWLYDSGQIGKWVDLFTQDTRWVWYAGPQKTFTVGLNGKTELRNFVEPRRIGLAEQGIQPRHYQTNTVFLSLNGQRAITRTYVVVLWQYAGELTPRPIHTGYYEDVFVKTRGGWKFKERLFFADHV